MSKRNNNPNAGSALCIIWILTAVAALCVTFIYFGKLGKLYSAAGATEPVLVPVTVEENGTIVKAEKTADGLPVRDEDGNVEMPDAYDLLSGSDSASTVPDESIQSGGSETVIGDTQEVSETVESAESQTETIMIGEAAQPDHYSDGSTPETTGTEEVPSTEYVSGSARVVTVRQEADENGKVCYFSSGRELDPSKPMIAMTFDDGPSARTGKIIEALNKVNGRATFFMVGYQLDYYKEYVQMVYESGNEIGNHTANHARLTKCSDEELKSEILGNEAAIQAMVPVGKLIVRPPYGSVNDNVKAKVQRPMFNWSVDSRDWETRDEDMIVEQVKQDARDGLVILMHDIYDSTMNAAIRLIPWLTEQGYQLVTVSEMFELREGGVKEGSVYRFTNEAE